MKAKEFTSLCMMFYFCNLVIFLASELKLCSILLSPQNPMCSIFLFCMCTCCMVQAPRPQPSREAFHIILQYSYHTWYLFEKKQLFLFMYKLFLFRHTLLTFTMINLCFHLVLYQDFSPSNFSLFDLLIFMTGLIVSFEDPQYLHVPFNYHPFIENHFSFVRSF